MPESHKNHPTMSARPLAVQGAFEFTPQVFPDERGIFLAPYQEPAFRSALGHPLFPVAQSNHSSSRRGVVRGVHFTAVPPGTAKYVFCPQGRSLDVVVDTRLGSPTFGRHDTVLLDQRRFRAVYLPVGVGHAFVALEEGTVMSYLTSGVYAPQHERAIDPLDTALGLPIPQEESPILSQRDAIAPTLAEARGLGTLPRYEDCLAVEDVLYDRRAASD